MARLGEQINSQRGRGGGSGGRGRRRAGWRWRMKRREADERDEEVRGYPPPAGTGSNNSRARIWLAVLFYTQPPCCPRLSPSVSVCLRLSLFCPRLSPSVPICLRLYPSPPSVPVCPPHPRGDRGQDLHSVNRSLRVFSVSETSSKVTSDQYPSPHTNTLFHHLRLVVCFNLDVQICAADQ